MQRALIATLASERGGVRTMSDVVLCLLSERGMETTAAWYEPYSRSPELSVPSFRLGQRRPSAEARPFRPGVPGSAIGAWLPELEFTTYWPTRPWRRLADASDVHLVVSGNCLAGLPFARLGEPFLAWIATDWAGDRVDRVRTFPWHRRLFDRLLVRPAMRATERRVLRSGRILTLSTASRRQLNAAAGRDVVRAVLPAPIDTGVFRPDRAAVVPGRIGFVGRFDDPRKNLDLFLEALAICRSSRPETHARIVGGAPSAAVQRQIADLGLEGSIEFVPFLDKEPLADVHRSLDLIAVTSHQEGLGIAFLEAMACGCPIVSTRCGGSDDYVLEDANGFLTGFDAAEIANRWMTVISDRTRRAAFGEGARQIVERDYSWRRVREIFHGELEEHLRAAKAHDLERRE